MDKRNIAGFVLIALILIIWMIWNSPNNFEETKPVVKDSTKQEVQPKLAEKALPTASTKPREMSDTSTSEMSKSSTGVFGKWFGHLSSGSPQSIVVQTDLYSIEFSSLGGGIRRFTLKNFSTWNGHPVQLIDWTLNSDLSIVLGTTDGKLIDTKDLYHNIDWSQHRPTYTLRDSEKISIQFKLPVIRDSSVIIKTFKIQNGKHPVSCEVEMRNMAEIISNSEYQIGIHSPALTEENSVDESGHAQAFRFGRGKLSSIDASDADQIVRENVNEKTNWISTRNKYFMNALIAENEGDGAYLEGKQLVYPDHGLRKIYSANLKVRYIGNEIETKRFILYIGPIEYDVVKNVHSGLEQTINLGWAWIVRPISEYFMLPLFKFLHSFIPNYGVVIILFSILIKIILLPLTKSSMDSMRKMQALQPLMNESKEKFKDDPQRMNAEMMRLYKDYGINPLGGCLPLLLQMPILYALFTVFGSTIQLRQASFFLWIHDLSIPDSILTLPFAFPIFGFTHISGLSLAMGITMFIQQKQSVKDPRQKSMVYMMPILFTLMFNGFPAGLNLYYFVFNLLSITQQYYLNKKTKDVPLQKIERSKKRKSLAERYLSSLQEATKQRKKAK